jgi:hypothetical protein
MVCPVQPASEDFQRRLRAAVAFLHSHGALDDDVIDPGLDGLIGTPGIPAPSLRPTTLSFSVRLAMFHAGRARDEEVDLEDSQHARCGLSVILKSLGIWENPP